MTIKQPPKSPAPKVIAAIPCYNEACFIGEIVRKAKEYVDLVIVVDDGSSDITSLVAEIAGASVVCHKENGGAGAATKSCFEAAKAERADIVVTLDGDNQHTPEDILRLIAPIIKREADLVIGSRFLGDNGNMPAYRKLGIEVITWLFNIGSTVKVSDGQSCFRAHSRRLIEAITITESGFGFSVQVLTQARDKGFIIAEQPISCLYHSESSTTNPVRHGIGVALTVVKLRFWSLMRRLIGGENSA